MVGAAGAVGAAAAGVVDLRPVLRLRLARKPRYCRSPCLRPGAKHVRPAANCGDLSNESSLGQRKEFLTVPCTATAWRAIMRESRRVASVRTTISFPLSLPVFVSPTPATRVRVFAATDPAVVSVSCSRSRRTTSWDRRHVLNLDNAASGSDAQSGVKRDVFRRAPHSTGHAQPMVLTFTLTS